VCILYICKALTSVPIQLCVCVCVCIYIYTHTVYIYIYTRIVFFIFYQPDDDHVWPKHVADLRTKYIVVFWLDLFCLFDYFDTCFSWRSLLRVLSL
jgi:hypothetical protein